MKAYVEGFGCSMNRSDTEQLRAALRSHGFALCASPAEAGLILINACAVKEPTENRMLRRIKELASAAKPTGAQLIVFGCIAKIAPHKVSAACPTATLIGPSLSQLLAHLGLSTAEFSPCSDFIPENPFVSVITIARGCTGSCTFCAVRAARGPLKSHTPQQISRRFSRSIKAAGEIWLTAQDTGAYGLDIGSSLPELLRLILKNSGNYRIRLGMMNPQHLERFYDALVPLFQDKRLYRFLHIPLQSGSDRVLQSMGRQYTVASYMRLVSRLRQDIPGITISTDAIVGFPRETDADFRKTVSALRAAKPDIVNISRYGDRPNTPASLLPGKVYGWVKKQRSRELSALCSRLSLERNSLLLGTKQEIYVSEQGKANYMGRTQNYKPAVIKQDLRGKFAKVLITGVHPSYLASKLIAGPQP